MTVKTRKKLIEVALPLEAINAASAREKSIRHGHPSTLHLWWARRPLAAARAVIFAQMVDDPSEYVDTLLGVPETRRVAEREWKKRRELWATKPDDGRRGREPTLAECAADFERQRLFDIIKELVQWENTTNEAVLQKARDEIWQSWRRACADNADHPRARELFGRHKLPAFHDPFAGGGSLPLEAQRLGLEAHASDLNPVAVLICKAMIEVPPKFAGRPPVNPEWTNKPAGEKALRIWKGAEGLAEDVRYYGRWMRDEAEKRIGRLYPKVEITAEMARERTDLKPFVGQKLTVIAWIWARTVKSPNPAFAKVDVPLASTFMLSTKPGKEAYVEPVIENDAYRFAVKIGKPKNGQVAKLGTTAGKRNAFRCLMSDVPISYDHIRSEGKAARIGTRLMAIVAESPRGRVFLAPTPRHESVATDATPLWQPDMALPNNPRDFKTPNYGLTTFADLFTDRQLVALTTFSDLVGEAMVRVRQDAVDGTLSDDHRPLHDGGVGATAYAEAVGLYLGLAVSRTTNTINALAIWSQSREQSVNLFSRQAVPMAWDFPEVNPFAGAAGDYGATTASVAKTLADALVSPAYVTQADAQTQNLSQWKLISTDPPYYDNVGYADLSDFFYVWLRPCLRPVFADLLATLAVPKAQELVATPYRHGSKEKAESFFLKGMTYAMHKLMEQGHPSFPVTIYYAFKQSESAGEDGVASTGWETFLDAVIQAGFGISGTWPIRTERPTGVKTGMNVLASSIVLACRPRLGNVASITRREFIGSLKSELPSALRHLQASNIAPVDLAQAAIGPGMAVYTRYAKVLDAEGKPVSVGEALALINATLEEALTEQEGDFDADSRWALAWFEQNGFAEGDYGVAEVLSKAKVTTVKGLAEAKIVESKRGKVRLIKPEELEPDWDPTGRSDLTVWEIVHQLIRALNARGESAAAGLVAKLGSRAEVARELAYRLYTICERKKRAAEALAYNGLVQSWPEIARLAREGATRQPTQGGLFEATEA
jgi:putative DNA methylase